MMAGDARTAGRAVSVVMPMHNAASFIDATVSSIAEQTFSEPMELCVYDDASTDSSLAMLEAWRARLAQRDIDLVIGGAPAGTAARGCGYASNRAVELSSAPLLCFLDADDEMKPERVVEQVALARERGPMWLVGSDLVRDPPGSTARYIDWLTSLSEGARRCLCASG